MHVMEDAPFSVARLLIMALRFVNEVSRKVRVAIKRLDARQYVA